MDSITDRLNIVFERTGLAKNAIAKRLTCSPQYVSHLCSGRNTPSIEVLQKIANEFSINLHWLITGVDLTQPKSNEVELKAENLKLKEELLQVKSELLVFYRQQQGVQNVRQAV